MNIANPELSIKLLEIVPELLFYSNSFLTIPSRKVRQDEFGTQTILEICNKQLQILQKIRAGIKLGSGLASAQIGEQRSIIVCYFKGDKTGTVIINPEITYSSNKLSKYTETCLSTKLLFCGEMIRPAFIKAKGFDVMGNELTFDFTDENNLNNLFNTRVFQHEYDHTLGKLVESTIPVVDSNQIINYKLEII